MMKRVSFLIVLMAFSMFSMAAYNRTLRIDYIFSGTDKTQEISVDEMSSFDGWAGRNVNMDKVLLRGNGQIYMTDAVTGHVLYRQAFSTLFQEWQATEEATRVRKSFENVFLLPMPESKVKVSVELYDFKGGVSVSMTHEVDPSDVLIRRVDPVAAPHEYILRSGSAEECIDVVVVAEGYTQDEMGVFYKDAQDAVDAILSHAPFNSYKDRFNFIAVALPSDDSGVSVPREGVWKKTALGSHFDTFYMERYLTTLRLRQMHDKLCGIPYEHIVILANTDTYGGGGIFNSYTLTTAHHKMFKPVVVHEFGHSFAGLGDEYYYDDHFVEYYYPQCEPWEPNITTMYDFDSKWKDMLLSSVSIPTSPVEGNIWHAIAEGTSPDALIGVYEGGGYQSKGVYRPYPDCRMKTNAAEIFCPVCQRAIARIIEFYTE